MILENIHTLPQTAFWNFEGKGGSFELEIRRYGSYNWKFEGKGKVYMWNFHDFVDLIMISLKINSMNWQQWIQDKHWSSRHVFVLICGRKLTKQRLNNKLQRSQHHITSFYLSSKWPHKLFCSFSVKHSLLTEDAILLLNLVGLRVTSDPEGSNSRSWKWKYPNVLSIVLPHRKSSIKTPSL